jgi:hypothetical protein
MIKMKTNFSFYEEADADSLKREDLLRNDPYYRDSILAKQTTLMDATGNLNNQASAANGLNNSPYKTSTDINEQRIYKR